MPSLSSRALALLVPALLASALLPACDRPSTSPASTAPTASSAAGAISTAPGSPTPAASPAASPAAASGSASAQALAPLSDAELGALLKTISEEGGKFPSDNYISNETSYLHVVDALAGKQGGAYIGVGPEQNFTYLALLAPEFAFIVDIRRENMVLHLLYKVLFETSPSRADFLAALVSRDAPTVAADAPVEAVVEAVKKAPHSASREAAALKLVTDRAAQLGLTLTADDRKNLKEALAAFGKQGLDIHYTMEGSSRKYPSLGELMAARDDKGQPRSFLATDATYQSVRRLQVANRVVPVVGDLAGDGALPRMAAELQKRKLALRVFYVSNIEQYLFEPKPWGRWIRNVRAMPWADDGVILRVYFDQGKPHPQQRAGHRTTSMVRPAKAFLDRADKGGWKSWWEVATE